MEFWKPRRRVWFAKNDDKKLGKEKSDEELGIMAKRKTRYAKPYDFISPVLGRMKGGNNESIN